MDQTAMTNCVFCEIIATNDPAMIIGSWPEAVAFEPLVSVTPGHLLVVPRAHVPDFRTSPQITGEVTARAAQIAALAGGADVNLITSAGPAATQTVFHFHVDLVPRRPDDGLALPWAKP